MFTPTALPPFIPTQTLPTPPLGPYSDDRLPTGFKQQAGFAKLSGILLTSPVGVGIGNTPTFRSFY
ncbi:MAG: hypothetical protein WKG07_28565 [Hymenobacter sp.]